MVDWQHRFCSLKTKGQYRTGVPEARQGSTKNRTNGPNTGQQNATQPVEMTAWSKDARCNCTIRITLYYRCIFSLALDHVDHVNWLRKHNFLNLIAMIHLSLGFKIPPFFKDFPLF